MDSKSTLDVYAEVEFETNGAYGQHFVTYPAVDNNHLLMKINKGSSEISFTVAAADNDSFGDSKYVRFILVNSTSERLTTQKILLKTTRLPLP